MKNNIIKSVLKELVYSISYTLENIVYYIPGIINLLNPYLFLLISIKMFNIRLGFEIGYEYLIPIILFVISDMVRRLANRLNVGEDIPIPSEPFTENDNGEISVLQSRIQEMILYVNDVENYLYRHGYINKK